MIKLFRMEKLVALAVMLMMVLTAFSILGFVNLSKASCQPGVMICSGGGEKCYYCPPDGNPPDDDDPNPPPITPTPEEDNNPPVANNDLASVYKDSSGNRIYVLANDNDPDGDSIYIFGVSEPLHGTADMLGSYISYTPTSGYIGGDSFTYTLRDEHDATDTATVTIAVNTVNTAPDAVNDFKTVDKDSSNNQIYVLSNDYDFDGDTISINAITIAPSHGTATISGSLILYTPTSGYIGGDSFTYAISDGNGGTDSATVTITVINANPGDEVKNSADTSCYRILLEVPTQPRPTQTQTGLQNCYVGISYDFESQVGVSYGGNAKIKFKFNWGDGTESPWIIKPNGQSYSPNEVATGTHPWANAGIYDVRVKAQVDPNGDGILDDVVYTDWSKPLPVIVQHISENPEDIS